MATNTWGSTATTMEQAVKEAQQKEQAAKLENMKREDQITAIYDEIIRRYQPGGSFQQAGLAELEKQKKMDVGKSAQQMISGGLFNTEAAAGLGRQWEATVGSGARLSLEDLMMGRLSSAQMGKANFLNSIESQYPDTSALQNAELAQGQQAGYGQGVNWNWDDSKPQPVDYTDYIQNLRKNNQASIYGEMDAKNAAARAEQARLMNESATPVAPVAPVASAATPTMTTRPTKSYMSPYVYTQAQIKAADARYQQQLAAWEAQQRSANAKPVSGSSVTSAILDAVKPVAATPRYTGTTGSSAPTTFSSYINSMSYKSPGYAVSGSF